MKRLVFALTVAAIGLPSLTLHAADVQGRFTVKGAGAVECARFSAAVQERGAELVSFAGWVEGYLSAMNRYETGIYDMAGWRGTEVMLAALTRYCGGNPESGFHEAVAKMAEQMRTHAVADQSAMVTLGNGETQVTVYRETIQRTQAQLALRGHYDGPVDGEWNNATASALKAFQVEKAVPASGLPDQFTLVHLLP
jgi:hypothetical protein